MEENEWTILEVLTRAGGDQVGNLAIERKLSDLSAIRVRHYLDRLVQLGLIAVAAIAASSAIALYSLYINGKREQARMSLEKTREKERWEREDQTRFHNERMSAYTRLIKETARPDAPA